MKASQLTLHLFVLIITLLICGEMTAQVGINTDLPEAALDISSSDSGLLIPRIALTDLEVAAPITNPSGPAVADGTMIWNNGLGGILPTGFYFWENNRWNLVMSDKEPSVYFGKFIIDSNSNINIDNVPFQPTSVEFTALNRVQDYDDGPYKSNSNNTNDLRMAGGQTIGYAQANGVTINQQVISNGFHGASINNIGTYSSDNHCIAAFFVNNNGDPIRDNGGGSGGNAAANTQEGLIRASLQSFNADGFTLNVDRFLAGNGSQINQIVVIYKAYR